MLFRSLKSYAINSYEDSLISVKISWPRVQDTICNDIDYTICRIGPRMPHYDSDTVCMVVSDTFYTDTNVFAAPSGDSIYQYTVSCACTSDGITGQPAEGYLRILPIPVLNVPDSARHISCEYDYDCIDSLCAE